MSSKEVNVNSTYEIRMKEINCICSNRRFVILGCILCPLLWGSVFPIVKVGYSLFDIRSDEISKAIFFAGLRFLIGGIVALIFFGFLYKGGIRRELTGLTNHLDLILLLEFIQTFFQAITFYTGLAHVEGTKASIINGVGTFINVILAHFFFKNDKLNINKCIGCIIGFCGLVLININTSSGSGMFTFNLNGELMIVLAAISFAVASLLTKLMGKGLNPVLLTGIQMLIGSLALIVTGVIMGGTNLKVTFEGVVCLLFLGFASAIALVLWFLLLGNNKLSSIAIYNFLIPIFGTVCSLFLLNEHINILRCFISLVLVSAGILLVNINISKKKVQ